MGGLLCGTIEEVEREASPEEDTCMPAQAPSARALPSVRASGHLIDNFLTGGRKWRRVDCARTLASFIVPPDASRPSVSVGLIALAARTPRVQRE